MTITVIYGAGASFDSDAKRTESKGVQYPSIKPPLAAELFDETEISKVAINRYPIVRSVIPRLRGATNAIEEELGKIQDEAHDDPIVARQLLLVRFFLRDIVTKITDDWYEQCAGVTNYAGLQSELSRRKRLMGTDLCYVTFNYDRLLDRALEDFYTVAYTGLDDYFDLIDGVSLYKLHGSVNWVQQMSPNFRKNDYEDINDTALNMMINAASKLIGVRMSDIHIGTTNAWMTENTIYELDRSWQAAVALLRALAVPVRTKYDFVLPDGYLSMLKGKLAHTTHLLVIGWRGQEDEFVNLLKAHLPAEVKALVVAESEKVADGTLRRLRMAGLPLVNGMAAPCEGFSQVNRQVLEEGFGWSDADQF